MKLKVVVPILFVGIAVSTLVLFVPGVVPVRASSGDRFDPVWDIMNRDRSEGGCIGCHIRPTAGFTFWFGADKESVRQTFETGVNPNGDDLGYIPVEGGRAGWLAWYLHNGIMPQGGEDWTEDQLALLDDWLITYEAPPDLFEPVWQIMNQDREVGGCAGCHIGKKPGFAFWFGGDKESVRQTLETGVNPNGDDLFYSPVEGGRAGWLAWYLYNGIMPMGGEDWTKKQLALLDAWLITYEVPPDPFEPVWQLMNQVPADGGCVGCHIRDDKFGTGPWFGPDKANVLNTLETGITPDGRKLFAVPVAGGSQGRLANFLRTGFMPRGGRRWTQEELDVLYQWLALYKE